MTKQMIIHAILGSEPPLIAETILKDLGLGSFKGSTYSWSWNEHPLKEKSREWLLAFYDSLHDGTLSAEGQKEQDERVKVRMKEIRWL